MNDLGILTHLHLRPETSVTVVRLASGPALDIGEDVSLFAPDAATASRFAAVAATWALAFACHEAATIDAAELARTGEPT